MYSAVSFFGVIALISIAWVFSENKRCFPWRTAGYGFLLQGLFAFFVFKVPFGKSAFLLLNDLVVRLFDCARQGAIFVFGYLALPPGVTGVNGEVSTGFILAFQALPTIIFFGSLMSVFYYLGILQKIIKWFAYLFVKLMRISGAESFFAANSIFVGIESALAVRPYLDTMTRSELCTILTAGMATIASSMMAIYVSFLHTEFPAIAGHLVSASILSAPAAVVFSKIIVPESDIPNTLGTNIDPDISTDSSLFEAVINGAHAGVKLIVGIVALLIAILGLVALADGVLLFAGKYINTVLLFDIDWSIKGLLGYLFYPFSLLIGIPIEDVAVTAQIIGQRLIVTELQSYSDLALAIQENKIIYPRSAVITAYALCGFAHVASLAIFTGGVTALIPRRAQVVASVGIKALFAATLACLATAACAGIFCSGSSVLLAR
ncbi:MAG: nucleoside transporter C-terminal domain-containing protein [Candidatus Auribacterota bacterium]|jgi:CNT family concentrative nucleoside transporter|nr:nucleoside transporter C-terminal domain-containing protein [Candidatus Auribacterota bacterium]